MWVLSFLTQKRAQVPTKSAGGANGGWVTAVFASLALFMAFLPLALALASVLAPVMAFFLSTALADRVAALAVIVSGALLLLKARELPDGSRERGYLVNLAYSTIGLGLAELLGGGGILTVLTIMATIAVGNYEFASLAKRRYMASSIRLRGEQRCLS